MVGSDFWIFTIIEFSLLNDNPFKPESLEFITILFDALAGDDTASAATCDVGATCVSLPQAISKIIGKVIFIHNLVFIYFPIFMG